MNKKILYIKSKWLDDKVLNSKVKVKNRLLPLDKYLYDFMFVKNNYKLKFFNGLIVASP